MSDDNTSIGPPPRRPAPRQVAPPKVRTGVTVPPGGGLRPVPEAEALALSAMMPAVVVPPPMPRSRAPEADPRFAEQLTAPTRAEAGPGTFGGEVATPTSVDGSSGGPYATDRGAPPYREPPDTGDAPHLGSEVSTHGGDAPRRPVPAVMLFLVPALVVGLGGSGLLLAFHPTAAASSAAEPPVSEPAPPAIEPELLWVAQVNEVDPARVLPFAERHERLERLAPLPEAAFVDRRLNLAFDLVQAAEAPDPCSTFAAALDALAAAPDPSLQSALFTAHAPTGDDPSCAGLDARRQALLAALSAPPQSSDAGQREPEADSPGADAGEPPGTPEPTPGASPRPEPSETETKAFPRRPSKAEKPKTKPTASTPPLDAPPVGRVDEELRPFGQ